MSNITQFENPSFGFVRVVMIDSDPWFVARDVAVCLGYTYLTGAVHEHCKNVDSFTENDNGQIVLQVEIISESDLFRLVLHSHLSTAEVFLDWITEDVIPSVRKTGSHKPQAATPTAYDKFLIMRDVLSTAYEGNQLALAIDKVCVHITGESALQIASAQLCTPTQIDTNVNPIEAVC